MSEGSDQKNRPKPVDYDTIAAGYDRRYARYPYEGVRRTLGSFVDGAAGAVAEVGCGTGRWLAELTARGHPPLFGADLSMPMLCRARILVPTAHLVRATAGQLPWTSGSFERVYCVNALHHFEDPQAFIAECRRVLRPGGRFLTIGLDPHRGEDRWWIYDYFPAALAADRSRYASTATIRAWLHAAGFVDAVTGVAEHINQEPAFDSAAAQGLLDRGAASQLMIITADEYERGMQRLAADRPGLRADLRLFATTAG